MPDGDKPDFDSLVTEAFTMDELIFARHKGFKSSFGRMQLGVSLAILDQLKLLTRAVEELQRDA